MTDIATLQMLPVEQEPTQAFTVITCDTGSVTTEILFEFAETEQ